MVRAGVVGGICWEGYTLYNGLQCILSFAAGSELHRMIGGGEAEGEVTSHHVSPASSRWHRWVRVRVGVGVEGRGRIEVRVEIRVRVRVRWS